MPSRNGPFWASRAYVREPGVGVIRLPLDRYGPIVGRFLQGMRMLSRERGVEPYYYTDYLGPFNGLLRELQHMSLRGALSVGPRRGYTHFHNFFMAFLRRLQREPLARNQFRITVAWMIRPGVMNDYMRGMIAEYGDTVNPIPRPVRES